MLSRVPCGGPVGAGSRATALGSSTTDGDPEVVSTCFRSQVGLLVDLALFLSKEHPINNPTVPFIQLKSIARCDYLMVYQTLLALGRLLVNSGPSAIQRDFGETEALLLGPRQGS